ncbi:MAG: 5'-nucleotidase C-terminal domain-containing protein [Opitutus sp.]
MALRMMIWLLFACVGAHVLTAAETAAIFVLIGDQHSAYARTAQFVAHVDRLKAANPETPLAVLIDGDSFELGNVVARRSEGAIDVAMFAALAHRAPTILNLGNHEPEFSDVATTVTRVSATSVTVIGNVRDRTSGELFAPASIHLRLGTTDVVVAGVTTDILAQYRAAVRPTLDLAAPADWAREEFPGLLSAAPIKIVMSHAGLRLDRGMFPFVPDGTLFVGAHDHARFAERIGSTLYVHSGSWNSHFSVVRLSVTNGLPTWSVEQVPIRDSDPADPALAALIAETTRHHLNGDDLKAVGASATEKSRTEAAEFVVNAVRMAADADAAFIGNTTFGDGLPAGEVTRVALDNCVRFDGTIWVAEISGERLRRLIAEANQGPDTPFPERQGEFHYASGPTDIVDQRTYRIATNDWGVKNRERYFGPPEIQFEERAGLRLKALTAAALATPPSEPKK